MRSGVAVCLFLMALPAAAKAPPFRIGPSGDLNKPGRKAVSAEAQKIADRALAAFRKGELAAAKKDFRKVLELAPNNAATLINLGLIEYRQKNFSQAEKLLQEAVRSEPDAGLAWLLLGVIRYDQEKYDAALAALAQAAYLEPRDARARHYLGVTIGKKGWYSGAEEEMRRAIELDANYAEAHYNLAVFYLQRVPPAVELARRHYYKAVDLGAEPDADLEKTLGK
jgi:Flp pilus assembly protein TadD